MFGGRDLLRNLESKLPGFRDRRRMAMLHSHWEDLVGSYVAKSTKPLRIDANKTLWVEVVHPSWITELRPVTDQLVRKIREFIEISSLRLVPPSFRKLEKIESPSPKEMARRASADGGLKSRPQARDVEKIQDPELKKILERLSQK